MNYKAIKRRRELGLSPSEMTENMSTSLSIDRLFTTRLLLRKIEYGDLPLVVSWSKSSLHCGDYLTPEQLNLHQMQQQLLSGVFWNDDERIFLIEKKEDGLPIGCMHYWKPTGKKDSRIVSIKIARPEERLKGYGTEAQKFLLIFLFERLGVERVEMYTDINNIAQQRCLQKLGFELVESLSYNDMKQWRTGNLYCLEYGKYLKEPIYRYHYE